MKTQTEHYEAKLAYEIDSSDLFEGINNGINIIVIDARKPEGYAREHIPGAINIPHRTMNVETTKHLSKEPIYVTYCDGIGCNASTKGALNMARLGFTVKELIGGIDWWKRDQYTTEGTEGVQTVHTLVCAC